MEWFLKYNLEIIFLNLGPDLGDFILKFGNEAKLLDFSFPTTCVFKSSHCLLQSEVISSQPGIVNLQDNSCIFNSGSYDLEKVRENESWMFLTLCLHAYP